VCGGTVHGGGATRGQGRIYRCSKSYGHVSRRAEPIERYVAEVVVERLARDDAADILVDHDRPDLDQLRSEADQLRRRMDALADEYAADTITLAQLTRATERLRARMTEIEEKMAATTRVDILGPLVTAGDARAAWDRLDVDRRRAVIGVLMSVVIHPPGRGTRLPDIDQDRDEFFRRISPTISIEWKTA
jgi:hypothetical protein